MKSSIRREYRSVEFEAKWLAELEEYLNELSEELTQYKIELKNEDFSTDSFAEFRKELDSIKNWSQIERITISKQDDKDILLHIIFDFFGSGPYGYTLIVETNKRSKIVGIASEIEKKLQLSKTNNWLISVRISLETAIVYGFVAFIIGIVAGRFDAPYFDKLGFPLVIFTTIFALSLQLGLAKLYPYVVIYDKSLGKSSGRMIKNDMWKLIGAIALIILGIFIQKIIS